MTNEELKRIARKYAEQNPPQCDDEVLRQSGITLNAEMVFEPFLKWLCDDYCIVPKSEVVDWIDVLRYAIPDVRSAMMMQIGAKRLFGSELFEQKE